MAPPTYPHEYNLLYTMEAFRPTQRAGNLTMVLQSSAHEGAGELHRFDAGCAYYLLAHEGA